MIPEPHRILLVSVLVLGGCRSVVVGNGDVGHDARPLQGFTKVSNRVPIDVTVSGNNVTGPEANSMFLIDVAADSNIVPLITTTVVEGVLVIDSTANLQTRVRSRIIVHLANLVGCDNEASGAMSISAPEVNDLTLKNAGSGALSFSGKARSVLVEVDGAGSMTLAGSGARLDGSVNGAGSLDAAQFMAAEATLVCNGAGGASVTVDGPSSLTDNGAGGIKATLNGGPASFAVNGAGSILWTGTSPVADFSVRGSGNVTHP